MSLRRARIALCSAGRSSAPPSHVRSGAAASVSLHLKSPTGTGWSNGGWPNAEGVGRMRLGQSRLGQSRLWQCRQRRRQIVRHWRLPRWEEPTQSASDRLSQSLRRPNKSLFCASWYSLLFLSTPAFGNQTEQFPLSCSRAAQSRGVSRKREYKRCSQSVRSEASRGRFNSGLQKSSR